jgi:hypothetical protein
MENWRMVRLNLCSVKGIGLNNTISISFHPSSTRVNVIRTLLSGVDSARLIRGFFGYKFICCQYLTNKIEWKGFGKIIKEWVNFL